LKSGPAEKSSWLVRATVRFVLSTFLVERLYKRFDHLRSTLVLAFCSDRFIEEYNAAAYRVARDRRAQLREGLLEWEQEFVKRFLPAPPARILVGGAGSGREPLALAQLGYSVVAFEPIESLAREMAAITVSKNPGQVEAALGSYADMPVLRGLTAEQIDLRSQAPFAAGVIGWGSFSHLATDAERTHALRQFAAVTRGPILVSFFGVPAAEEQATNEKTSWLEKRAARRGMSRFSIRDGYRRLLSSADFQTIAKDAGVSVLYLDCEAAWPHAVVEARSDSRGMHEFRTGVEHRPLASDLFKPRGLRRDRR
jgi:hypothetical protein